MVLCLQLKWGRGEFASLALHHSRCRYHGGIYSSTNHSRGGSVREARPKLRVNLTGLKRSEHHKADSFNIVTLVTRYTVAIYVLLRLSFLLIGLATVLPRWVLGVPDFALQSRKMLANLIASAKVISTDNLVSTLQSIMVRDALDGMLCYAVSSL